MSKLPKLILILALIISFCLLVSCETGDNADISQDANESDIPSYTSEPAGIMRNMTTMDIVRDMGIGINLGNTLEATGAWIRGYLVMQYEMAWGSPLITEDLIKGYADAGFGVVRIPVAWSNLMEDDYTISPELMARVAEITDWVIKHGMYAIINIHWDGGWWEAFPTDYDECLKKYTRIWEQISGHFKDYGDKLMFESANEELGWDTLWNRWGSGTRGKAEAYLIANNINQTFVNVVRSSDGNNTARHLLIAGYHTDIELTCDPMFVMPVDPAGRCAVSVHYYTPPTFAILEEDASWGDVRLDWGTDEDFAELNRLMDLTKETFVDNGIPVIFGEFGSPRAALKDDGAVFRYITSVAEAIFVRGMCPVLWDITISEIPEQGAFFSRSTFKMIDPEMEARFREITRMPRAGSTGEPLIFSGVESYALLGPVTRELTPDREIVIPVASYSYAQGVDVLDDNTISMENGFATYTVDIPADGRYAISLSYAPMTGSRANIELSVEIDGIVPFREARVCQFARFWQYSSTERSFDNNNNMLRPSSIEEYRWSQQYISDKEGYYLEPFAFYLPAGQREITLRSVREPVMIGEIRLVPPPRLPSYTQLSSTYDPSDIVNAEPVTVLAVDSVIRNNPSILPVVDLTNPYLTPFSLETISYNVMGGDMWCIPGQMIAWELDIPKDGLYSLSFVYKQDAVVGLPVTRALSINGEIPFEEAKTIEFPYSSNWERMTLNVDGEDALIYLKKGKHEISLTVTLGPVADICRRVSDISSELSQIYTQIIMITGPFPDNMRDYRIDERLPDIMPKFADIAQRLDQISEDISAIGGGRNDALSISIMASQLHDFGRRPDSIPERLPRFKDNVINLAIWILIASEMPLALYSVSAAPPDTEFEPVRPGFWGSIWFTVQRFFSSFTSRAENAGNSYDEDEENLIEVWGRYGKDMSELLKRLIDERFTPETGIKVNYNIIMNDNLMFFNLAAGTGPDVCLNIAKGYPLDFGLRGAAVDLAKLPGYGAFEAQFAQTSMLPNTWDSEVYGFPVVQQLPVLFVRTDIFNDLGLAVPDTWDDFHSVIGTLGVHNLQVSPSGELLPYFILQNGGEYFSEDLKTVRLDDPIGVAALTQWTNLFTLHGAPVQSDFFNRFRTGEMPIGIGDHSLYNMLDFAALEIKGDWAMFPVPGVMKDNGSIDRTVITSAGAWPDVASSSGFIAKSRPERTDNAWEFVQWFMSEEIQVLFALEIEAMFGPAGRYNSANMAAVRSVSWDRQSYDTIMTTFSNIREIPGVPGAYFIGRHMGNAFNEIVLSGESPRAAMRKYVEVINAEIARKRIELGLD